jgi:hypothetical protein
MKRRSSVIATLAIFALLIAACGVEQETTPTSTPAPPAATSTPTETPVAGFTATCVSTQAYANEHIVAVIGQDTVPTAFDAINSGSCQISEPIVQIRITLTSGGSEQVAMIDFPAGTTDFAPHLVGTALPRLLGTLKPGRYEREVTAVAADGREVEIQGFEPVILVVDIESTQAQLLKAQSRWERAGIVAYTYMINTDCFCLPGYRAAVDVEVVGGHVTSVTFVDAELTGEVPDQHRFGTIAELLEIIQDAHDEDAHSIRAEYDEQMGFPVEVFIDYKATIADEEQGFRVSDVRY